MLAGCEFGVQEPAAATAPAAATRNQPERVAAVLSRFSHDFAGASQQAAREGKPLLLFFTAEWCQFCQQMADEAFSNPQVQSLSNHFVCVLVDADAEPQLCTRFDVTAFPTIQFVSPRGVALQRIVGKQPGHQLMMAMQAALQSVARRTTDTNPLLR
jgi:thiol:disulfide interchange protein